MNAITLVALGTSLPDLFASKTAAIQEQHADNCIGNVTGSNSVNVFLGLGLPWLIAAVYWKVKAVSSLFVCACLRGQRRLCWRCFTVKITCRFKVSLNENGAIRVWRIT